MRLGTVTEVHVRRGMSGDYVGVQWDGSIRGNRFADPALDLQVGDRVLADGETLVRADRPGATIAVVLSSSFDREDGVWEAEAAIPHHSTGYGRHERCVDAQALALRSLADRLQGVALPPLASDCREPAVVSA